MAKLKRNKIESIDTNEFYAEEKPNNITIEDVKRYKEKAENEMSEILDRMFDSIGFVPASFNLYTEEIEKETDDEYIVIGHKVKMDISV